MSEFEIFLSSKGPLLLEGEQKLKVIDSVVRGKQQFSEIVADTGLAKSTVSVNLGKLADDGLIQVISGDNEKRYVLSSFRMISSVEPDPQGIINILRIWDSKKEDDRITSDNLEKVMIAYLVIDARQQGMSFLPILVEVAKLIARVGFERTEDRSIEAVTGKISEFFRRSGYADVSTVSVFPPTFDISMRFEATDVTRSSILQVFYRFITEYISLTQSQTLYVSDVRELGDEKRTVRLTLGFRDIEPEYCNGNYHDFKIGDEGFDKFAIYKVEGSFAPVVGDLQMRIINCIEKRPYSSRDLMGELKEPQTTILGHLKKMEEAKIIRSFKSGNRSVYYMSSERIFAWSRPKEDYVMDTEFLRQAWEIPEHVVFFFLQFFIKDSYELGFDISALLTYLGKRVGDMIVSMFPNITAESLFSMLQKESMRIASAEVALLTYNPPTVVRLASYDIDPTIAECQRVFYNAIFCTIFGKLMHAEFVVKQDRISGEGLRRYEASFVPKIM